MQDFVGDALLEPTAAETSQDTLLEPTTAAAEYVEPNMEFLSVASGQQMEVR